MPDGDFTLTIEDETLAAWIPITNTFTIDDPANFDRQRDFWTGVLFQLGHYERVGEEAWSPGFGQVEFTLDDNTTFALAADEFRGSNATWINIGRELLPGEPRTIHMGNPGQGRRDLCKLMLVPEAVPIRKFFHAYPAGITLWHDHGYALKVNARADRGESYEFTIARVEGFQVQILQNTTPGFPLNKWEPIQSNEWSSIKAIAIQPQIGVPTGGKKDPPQRP